MPATKLHSQYLSEGLEALAPGQLAVLAAATGLPTPPEHETAHDWWAPEEMAATCGTCRAMVDIIREQWEADPHARGWAEVYTVSREYGGPEEGGWYYDWWTRVLGVRIVRSDLPAFEAMLVRGGEGPFLGSVVDGVKVTSTRGSVIGGPDRVLKFNLWPCENESTVRPHYA